VTLASLRRGAADACNLSKLSIKTPFKNPEGTSLGYLAGPRALAMDFFLCVYLVMSCVALLVFCRLFVVMQPALVALYIVASELLP